uniref:EVE domain-containing protein n=1 Tax=Caenorhabditis tropicalis TaxID=1561998 RepID=A0A1I7V4K6_9PELO
MSSISLYAFLDSRCPGWEGWDVDTLNARMRVLGTVHVSYAHRPGTRSGVLRFVPARPDQIWFHWKAAGWVSVANYFRARYGRNLDGRDSVMVYFAGYREEDLFPLEVLRVGVPRPN